MSEGNKIVVGIYTRKLCYKGYGADQYAHIKECKKKVLTKLHDKDVVFKEYNDIHYPTVTNLKGIQRLVDDVRAGKVNVLCVYTVSELVGSAIELKHFFDAVTEKKMRFISIVEDIDSSMPVFPVLKAAVGIIAGVE